MPAHHADDNAWRGGRDHVSVSNSVARLQYYREDANPNQMPLLVGGPALAARALAADAGDRRGGELQVGDIDGRTVGG